jgi:hypothetical protein
MPHHTTCSPFQSPVTVPLWTNSKEIDPQQGYLYVGIKHLCLIGQ